jgi:hypothetical protein
MYGFISGEKEILCFLRNCCTTKEDGCPRRRCHVDEDGFIVMKACLEDPVDSGTSGYRPSRHGPLKRVLPVSRSLIKKKKG